MLLKLSKAGKLRITFYMFLFVVFINAFRSGRCRYANGNNSQEGQHFHKWFEFYSYNERKKINLRRKQLKNWQGLTSSINLKFHTAWDPYHILSPNKSIKAMMEAHVCWHGSWQQHLQYGYLWQSPANQSRAIQHPRYSMNAVQHNL